MRTSNLVGERSCPLLAVLFLMIYRPPVNWITEQFRLEGSVEGNLPQPFLWNGLSYFSNYLPAHFSRPLKSLWIGALPSSITASQSNMVSSTSLLRRHPIPLSRLLIKSVNGIVRSNNPWGVSLAAGHKLDCAADHLPVSLAVGLIFHSHHRTFIQFIYEQFG